MIRPDKTTLRRQSGFTLIELLIVIAIVAILASVAIPAYFDQVTRSKRTDATASLTNIAQQLERCFTTTNTYVGCLGPTPVSITSTEGEYNITATLNATNYTLTATATGSQSQDQECGNFTLNQTGLRGISGTGTAGACW